jgi:hypothetical protein
MPPVYSPPKIEKDEDEYAELDGPVAKILHELDAIHKEIRESAIKKLKSSSTDDLVLRYLQIQSHWNGILGTKIPKAGKITARHSKSFSHPNSRLSKQPTFKPKLKKKQPHRNKRSLLAQAAVKTDFCCCIFIRN